MRARILQIFFSALLMLTGSIYLDAAARETWYNPYTGITISTQYRPNGMYVTGLYKIDSKNWFKRIKKYKFRDNNGNELTINQDKLVYTARRNRARLTFYTTDRDYKHKPAYQRGDYENINNNEKDFGYLYDTNKNPGVSQNYGQDAAIQAESVPASVSSIMHVEGTWSVKNIAQKVYVTETREGIKARFTDNMKWTDYNKIPDTNTYQDAHGNIYTLDKENLIWHDKSGQKTFILTKISNDLIE